MRDANPDTLLWLDFATEFHNLSSRMWEEKKQQNLSQWHTSAAPPPLSHKLEGWFGHTLLVINWMFPLPVLRSSWQSGSFFRCAVPWGWSRMTGDRFERNYSCIVNTHSCGSFSRVGLCCCQWNSTAFPLRFVKVTLNSSRLWLFFCYVGGKPSLSFM